MKKLEQWILLVLLIMMTTGCALGYHPRDVVFPSSRLEPVMKEKQLSPGYFAKQEIIPLIISDGSFNSSIDWVDNQSIMYIANGREIYLYHIFSGESELFFKAEDMIIDIQSNSDRSLFSVQITNGPETSLLLVLNSKGERVFSKTEESQQVEVTWSPYHADQLIVTTFMADWSYMTQYIEVTTQQVRELHVENPFVQWISEETLGYLLWNQTEPSIYAPLYHYQLTTDKVARVNEEDVVGFFSFKDRHLTVKITEEQQALYSFFHYDTGELIQTETVPMLETFSEYMWYPKFDYNKANDQFFYYRPLSAGDLFQYRDGFVLSSFSLRTGKREELLKVEDNFPLQCSPDGRYCLTGYQLERIVDLVHNNIQLLIKQ